MGDIADAMLDGTLCECCGTYIGEGDGFPRYCSRKCADDRGSTNQARSSAAKVACPYCSKRIKSIGLWQHIRDAHSEKVIT